ncbi:MAG: DUF992 domain-containing protein [Pseudomonadota bacterium]
MRRIPSYLCFALAVLVLGAADANAQSRTQVGVLECRSPGSVGLIVGSVTNFGCVLRVTGNPDDLYTARITKVGVDLGITGETGLSWAVFAPTVQIGPGALSGNYAGVDASAAIGVGVGGNAMVGGSNNTYALQPLSVQGQTGINVAGGVQSMELRPGRY